MKNQYLIKLLLVCIAIGMHIATSGQGNVCNSNALKPVFRQDFGQAASSTSTSKASPGSTNYNFGNVGTDGNYIVTPRVENANKADWTKGGDHTGNTNGNLFLVNAGGNNSIFFRDTAYNLCQGSIFNFTAWLANVNTPNTQGVCGSGLVYAKVIFRIRDLSGTILGSVTTGNLPLSPNNGPLNWQQYGFQFSLPASINSVIFEMVDFYGGGAQCGNDLALDDILFTACTPQVTANVSANSTSCVGNRDTISSSLVNSPYVNPAFQWQKSIDGGSTWNNVGIPGTTAGNLIFTNVTPSDNGLYRVLVGPDVASLSSQTCVAASNSVPFGVNGVPTINITNNNPVCDSSTLHLNTTTTGGSGVYSYVWSGPNSFVSGSANPSKINTIFSDSGYYTVIVTDSKGCKDTAITKVNVTPVPLLTIKNNLDTICSNSKINIALSSSLNNSYFKWQSFIISGNVTGNTNQTTLSNNYLIKDSLINTSNTVARVQYIINTISDSGCISKTDTVYITVQPLVTIANAGADQKLCNATTASLLGNTPISGTGIWTVVGTSTAVIANPFSPTTIVTGLTGNSNNYFVWKISGANVCKASTDTVLIINRPAITIANAGNDTIICNFNTATLATIQLHSNSDTLRNFELGTWSITVQPAGSNISFSNNNSPTSTFSFNKAGTYQLVWTISNDNNCPASKDTITINVFENPVAGSISANVATACAGTNANFSLTNFKGNIFKWQYKSKVTNNSWRDSLITTSVLAFTNIQDTITVRAIVTSLSNNCLSYDTAKAVTININPITIAGVLSADTNVCAANNQGKLYVKNYTGNIIRWEYSNDNGTSWTNINITTDSIVFSNLTQSLKYRVLVQSGVCSASYTNVVTVKVAQPVTLANAGFDRLLCQQDSIQLNANNPLNGIGIWQQIAGIDTVVFADKNNSSTFITKITPGIYRFVWSISNQVCISSFDTVQITMQPFITNNIDTNKITVCYGQSVNANGNPATGGNGIYSYQWQQSLDGITWNNITGADSASHVFIGTQNIYLRRIITSNPCNSISNMVHIMVQSAIRNNSIQQNQIICLGNMSDSLTGNLPNGGNGLYSYQWQQSLDTIGWNNITTAATKNYNAGIVQQTTFYRRIVTTNLCNGNQQSTSNIVGITVNPNAKAGFSVSTLQNCEPFILDSNIVKPNLSPFNASYKWLLNDSVVSTQNYFPQAILGSYFNNVNIKLIAYSLLGCKNDTAQQNITVLHKPQPSFSLSDTIGCGPLTVGFNNTTNNATAYNFQWNFGNGQTSTQTQPNTIIYNTSVSGHDTTYTITLKVFNTCDTVIVTKKVLVKRKVNVQLNANTVMGCSPLTVQFTNQSVGDNLTQQIYWGDGQDSTIQPTSTFQHIYHSGINAVFNATLLSKNSCGIDTAIIPITIKPNPSIVDINLKDSAVCGKSITIINKTKNASQFKWNFGDGTSTITTVSPDSIKHTYAATGNYTISININNGCSDTSITKNIYLYKAPVAAFTVGNNICVGDSVLFVNQTVGANSVLWKFGDGNSSTQNNPFNFYSIAGNYNIWLIAKQQYQYATCTDSITKPVTIIAQKPGYMQVSDTLGKCVPFTVTFINKSVPSVKTTWNFGDGAVGNGDTVTHTYTANGYFKASMLAVAPGGCMFIDSNIIHIAAPVGNIQIHAGYSCINTPVTFSATTNNTDSIKWNFGDGSSTVSTTNITHHNYLQSGIYATTATLFNKTGCSVALQATDTIKVDAVKADFNLKAAYECGATTYSFTDSSSAFFGMQNILWTINNIPVGNAHTFKNKFILDGIHSINLKAIATSGCIDSAKANINVIVHQFPRATINGVADACKEVLLNMQSNIASRDSIFYRLWNLGNGTTSKDTMVQVTYFTAGNYSVKLTVATVNQCYDSAFKLLSIHPEPTITINNPQRICRGDSVSIIATGANNYVWKDAANNIICNNCNSIKVAPAATTQYNVIGYSLYGCSNIKNTNINVVQPFKMMASKGDSICVGNTIQLAAAGANTYAWYPTIGLSKTNGSSTFATPTVTTTYHVVGKDAFNCFADTANITLAVGNATPLNIGKDTLIMSGTVYTFKPITLRNDIKKWEWKGAAFNCNTCSTPQAKIIYDECISCTATNAYGCVSNDTICINTFCPTAEVFVPNAFSPDGDGINDKLVVQGKGIKLIKSFRVFNRWGEMVFERSNFNVGDASNAWDGTVRGKAASPDVYVYVCEVICEKGYPAIFKGNTMILK